MVCWIDNTARKQSNQRWFYVTSASGSPWGYVNEAYATRQTTVPSCSTKPGIWASIWASSHGSDSFKFARGVSNQIGLQTVPNGDKDLINSTYGNPGWDSLGWADECLAYVEAAWLAADDYKSIPHGYGSAYGTSQHVPLKSGTPPPGALVFWGRTTANPLGHVMVSMGFGAVAGTRDNHTGKTNYVTTISNVSSIEGTKSLGYWMP
jgi:hypothetical protein